MDHKSKSASIEAVASRFRAVAVDLDGTALRPDSTLSERNLAALKACADRGIAVVIVTGRSPRAAEKFRALLQSTGPMVYYNGAAVVDAPSGKVLASTLVPTDVVAGCLEVARRLGLHFQAFLSDDRLVCRTDTPERAAYQVRTGLQGDILDFDQLLSLSGANAPSFIKCMFIAEPDKLDEAQLSVDSLFGTRVYRTRSTSTFLEVMNNGVNKGHALKVALNLRGVEAEDCVAFGDMENDISMLEAVGWGVAMANAEANVKHKADDVAFSNVEDGVAVYLESLLALKR
ncbi:MAG: Cof-type HAD-IIB family hydrolase [Treponemataceae bacterium]